MRDLLKSQYRIIQELSEGGFGKTFLAEDTHLPSNRKCVIKQFKPPGTLNSETYQVILERFHKEASFLENLSEENSQIPKLYASFSESNQFYIVQEWIDGITLQQKMEKEGKLNEKTVRDILLNLLPVLIYTHSKGVIHRDIKPPNIILREKDGKPVLIDFGAVKEVVSTVIDEHGTPVRPSIVIGTPGYMPLEQVNGLPVFSSDLYSLGITAIVLLTGKQPQQLIDYRDGEIRWQKHAPGVSPSFATVLNKAIESSYPNRYVIAQDMLVALQEAIKIEEEREAERLRAAEEAARRKIAELYKVAQGAIDVEDWSLAIDRLEELLRLDPSNSAALTKLNYAKEQLGLANLFAAGLEHLSAGRWHQALDDLRRVKEIDSSYKDVAKFISDCEGAINKENVDTLYNEALKEISKENWSSAIVKLKAVLALDPLHELAKGSLQQVEQSRELATLYEEGQTFYKNEQWEDALRCFRAIQDVEKDYKDVEALIKHATEELAQRDRKEQEAQVASLYRDAITGIENENWPDAINKLKSLLEIDPSHKKAKEKLDHAQRQYELWTIYKKGKEHFNAKRWNKALVSFQKVQAINSDYKDVNKLIAATKKEIEKKRSPTGAIKVASISLVLLVVFGLLFYKGYFNTGSNVSVNRNTIKPPATSTPDVAAVPSTPTPSPTPSPSPSPTPKPVTVKLYLKYNVNEETLLITLHAGKNTPQKNPDEGNPIIFSNVICGQDIRLSALYSYGTIVDEPVGEFYKGYLGCDKSTVDLGRFAIRYNQEDGTFFIEPY